MKKRLALPLLFAIVACTPNLMEDAFNQAENIVKNIEIPTFPEKEYNIVDFGAVADEPQILNHQAINNAITAAHEDGGGVVIVPKGTFHTGPIVLKSFVNLHIEEDAVLKFTTEVSYYYPPVLTRWEGMDCYNAHPLIYAYEEKNIAITGKGTIDGSASNENWWSKKGSPQYGYEPGMINQRIGRDKLMAYQQADVPVEGRIMTEEDGLRPQLINLYRCTNILIEGVHICNSPFWIIHPLFCDQMVLRNVTILSHGPNSDGCDPESSSNILIENCVFDTGDDCIAIKSGRNNDGRRWNIPSENIVVRNCKMKDGHAGVAVGSEISGGYRNLYVENCEMSSPELDRAIRIKTSNCRGGIVENVYVRNITVGECKEAVLKINLIYDPSEQCVREYPPIVRNVYLENVIGQKSRYGVYITGLEDRDNVYNINLTNCKFDGVEEENSIVGAKDVHFKDLYINSKLIKN
ncbi:MAG: glycoside hydrolase family 28 protein [Bacteroidales bacterium]|nr:glycoside hydrolase family 28 protein [Bacteroidales bacterium]MCL2133537.1 glycoside hydrolase family 28 protein [Bacteroidales bacterium]